MSTGLATKTTALFSLESVKTWLKATSPDDDDRIIVAANAASEELEQQLGRIFVTRTCSQTVYGNGKAVVALRWRPVLTVTSVTIDGATIDATGYWFDPTVGLLYLKSRTFTPGIGNVVVSYTAGYGAQDAATLPGDIVRAGLDLAKAIYDELTSGAIAASSVQVGGQTLMLKPSKFPPSVQRVLDSGWKENRA